MDNIIMGEKLEAYIVRFLTFCGTGSGFRVIGFEIWNFKILFKIVYFIIEYL